jgi:hypothetical protein
VREFNQAALDAHLAEMSATLTPEQAEQFQHNVRQRVATSNIDLSPESVDGAFDLLAAIGHAGTEATGLSDRIGSVLSGLDPRSFSIGLPGADLGDIAGDVFSGIAGGIGKLFGGTSDAVQKTGDAVSSLGGSALGKIGDTASGAINLGGNVFAKAGDLAGGLRGVGESGLSTAGDLAGNAGDLAGGVGGAMADLIGSAGGAIDVGSGAADLAGAVLGALGDVLGSLGDL